MASVVTKLLICISVVYQSMISSAETIVASASEFENGTISCEAGRSCIIYCEHERSCMNTQIECPEDQACIISCGSASNACYGATIDARQSSLLEVNDCHSGDDSTCQAISIYFPPHQDGQKVAFLNTGDNMRRSLNFYAIYGWLDIDSSGFIGEDGAFSQSQMHCSFWYQQHCDFHSEQLSCANATDLCNSPPITHSAASSDTDSGDIDTTPSPVVAVEVTGNHLLQDPVVMNPDGEFSIESIWYVIVAVMGYLCCCSFVAMFWINRNLQRRFDAIVISRAKTNPHSTASVHTTTTTAGGTHLKSPRTSKLSKSSKYRLRSKSSPMSSRRKKSKKKKPHILSMDGDHDVDGEHQTETMHTVPQSKSTALHHHLRHNRPRPSSAKYTAIHEQEPMQLLDDDDRDHHRITNHPETDRPEETVHNALVPRSTMGGPHEKAVRRGTMPTDCSSPLQIPTYRRDPHTARSVNSVPTVPTVQSLAAASKVVHCGSDAASHLTTIPDSTIPDSTRTETTCTGIVNSSCNSCSCKSCRAKRAFTEHGHEQSSDSRDIDARNTHISRVTRLGASCGGNTGDIHTVVEAADLTVTSASRSVSPDSPCNSMQMTVSRGYEKTVTCETSLASETTGDIGMSNETQTRTALRVSTLHPMSNDSWLSHHPHGRQSKATYTISRDRSSRRSTYRVSSSRDWSEC